MEYFMSAKDAELVECSWTRFWRTVIEGDKLIENHTSYYNSLDDIVKKCHKLNRSSGLGLVGRSKKEENEELDKRVKETRKVAMEVAQAALQDCVKTIAFK
jgi:predicted AAA+ superfamily ATPase